MNQTKATVSKHLTAFVKADIDKIVSTYADDAMMLNEDNFFRGTAEIRSEFERLFDKFEATDLSESGSLQAKTVDDYGYIVWSAETPSKRYEHISATFVIPEDEIVFQSMNGVVRSKD